MKKKRINSCRKGKRAELDCAKYLTRVTGFACRRGQQHRGGTDSPDVIGLDHYHVECKDDRSVRLGTKAWREAFAKADREALLGGAAIGVCKIPLLFWREAGKWRMTFGSDSTGLCTVTGDDDIRRWFTMQVHERFVTAHPEMFRAKSDWSATDDLPRVPALPSPDGVGSPGLGGERSGAD